MKKEFRIVIASPSDYENLVAEIYFGELFVALVSQEREAGEFEIETPPGDLVESTIARRVPIAGFLKAVSAACEHLSAPLRPT